MNETNNQLIEDILAECLERSELEGDDAVLEVLARYPQCASSVVQRLQLLKHLNLYDGTSRAGEIQVPGFKVIRPLGRGGTGDVFLASQESLGRTVALKFLRPGLLSPARFRREARVIASLHHPHIVKVYVTGEIEGTLYIAMEYIEGKGLDEILHEKESPVEISQVIEWGKQISGALGTAHKLDLVHRDVKPSNIRIDGDGHAILLDFGLTRDLGDESLSQSGAFLGSPQYAPPEQVLGLRNSTGPPADVYSLGTTLYECIAQEPPFQGDTAEQIFQQVLNKPSPLLKRKGRRLSRDLEAVIGKALEKDPERRYPDGNAMSSDLESLLSLSPVTALRAGAMRRSWFWVKVNSRLVSCLALALSVTLFMLIRTEMNNAKNRSIEEAKRLEALKTATERLAEFQGMSDIRLARRLEQGASALWPQRRHKLDAFEEWLHEAESLSARLDEHIKTLRSIRERDVDGSMPDSIESRWKISVFSELIDRVENWQTPRLGLLDIMRHRMEVSEEIEERTLDDFEDDWAEAIEMIANSDLYSNLALEAKVGLIPLGLNTQTGLWEFWHWETGEMPTCDSEGEWRVTETSGLIFVLLPGGDIGSRARRSLGLTISSRSAPFFISKYEMTQGQWIRLTEDNPSLYGPEFEFSEEHYDLSHPVELVSWDDCMRALRIVGLTLPTELQWEYAAAGGRGSTFFSGELPSTLHGYANISGRSDGSIRHGSVGSYKPNPFGLFDVFGNVAEWTRDAPGAPLSSNGDPDVDNRLFKGGSFLSEESALLPEVRYRFHRQTSEDSIGLRPVAEIQ